MRLAHIDDSDSSYFQVFKVGWYSLKLFMHVDCDIYWCSNYQTYEFKYIFLNDKKKTKTFFSKKITDKSGDVITCWFNWLN